MNENLLAALFLLTIFSPVIYQFIVVLREHKKERQVAMKRFKKFLKYTVIIAVIAASTVGVLSHTNYLDYKSPMGYDSYDEITFENFRGIELFKKSLYGTKEFAYIVTSIDLSFEQKQVRVEAMFHPSRSFVYNKHSNSEELLQHEKYHFKITELYARKAREQISELNTFSKNDIKNIVKNIWTKEREHQEKYDYDTFHSYVYSEQKRYERNIDSLLYLLSDYQKPTVTIHEKN